MADPGNCPSAHQSGGNADPDGDASYLDPNSDPHQDAWHHGHPYPNQDAHANEDANPHADYDAHGDEDEHTAATLADIHADRTTRDGYAD